MNALIRVYLSCSKRVECEEIYTTETNFIHYWNNDTFCLNVYGMSN